MAFQIGKTKILTLSSDSRTAGSPSNFSVNVGSAYNLEPTYCSYHQVSIPNGFYNVPQKYSAFSCTLNYTNGGTTTPYQINVSITPGNYTTSTLVSNQPISILYQLQQALNNAIFTATGGTAGSTFFAITQAPLTGQTIFTTSQANYTFTINFVNQLDYLLGFRASLTSTAVASTQQVISPTMLDIRGPPVIHIRCPSLVTSNYNGPKGVESFLCSVQNTANFGQTIFQRSPTPELDVFPISGSINTLQFQLVDEYGTELTMDSGQEWAITIGLYSS